MNRIYLHFLALILLFSTITIGQPDLTLERIFTSDEFKLSRFGPARWLEDGKGYTILETSPETGGEDIIQYDPVSGERTILVSSKSLTPEGRNQPLAIDDYQWSSDKKRLLIFTNTVKVWRDNTRGDYWVLHLKSGKLQQLGKDAPKPSTLMFAKFSPDGKRVGYVRENNIYVETLKSGEILAITTDGSETIVNGTSDWVYEEEFSLRDCFSWSPDGEKIAYWRFDKSSVGTFYMINNTDSIYSRPIPLPYPKVGTTNSAVQVGVISAKGGTTTWFNIPGDLRNNYVPRMEWAANSKEVMIQRMNRLQNTNTLLLGDIKDGSVKTVMVEKDDAWIDIHDNLKWFENGNYFTWLSDRDGWRHLYLISRDGSSQQLLTPGDYDIVRIEMIDDKGGWVYFIASPDNPTQRYLYRASLDGKGKTERLTPAGQPGIHSYQISPGAKWAFHTFTSFGIPPANSLISLPDHRQQKSLVDNKDVKDRVDKLAKTPAEFFRVTIEGNIELDAWEMRPPNFAPNKQYPLLMFVYGEPAGQTVLDRWRGNRYLWHLYLTQLGYVVISVDNRGTPGPRGRNWRKIIYEQIGILASADQAAAVKALLASKPYLDPERVGSWGWSGGGQMTLNALFRYPEIYRTGIALAFVSDQRLYDTVYQERFMGLPTMNKDGYINGSPITFAHRLQGNLFIAHGTGDDNVHYQSFERLVNELILHDKDFSMMVYPNRSHSINEGENTSRHLFRQMTNYLLENLPLEK